MFEKKASAKTGNKILLVPELILRRVAAHGNACGTRTALTALEQSCVHLIALICSVLPFVERCMSHSDLEMAHDGLAVGLSGPRGRSGLFHRMDADRVRRSMCDAT